VNARKIEKRPPALTGDRDADLRAMKEYLDYLHEQMNFILSLIYKQMNS